MSHRLIGTQIYPWLQYYRAEGKAWQEHLPEILDQVVESGLDLWEPIISCVEDAQHLEPLLKERNLKMISIYAGGCLHTGDVEQAIDHIVEQALWVKHLGVSILVCNPNPSKDGAKNDTELTIQSKSLQKLGEKLKAQGIQLAYHMHTPELQNAARELHHMMLHTDKALGLCLDTHWIYRGAGNSNIALMDIFELYKDRVVTTHLRQSQNQIWDQTLREGDLDYHAIFKKLDDIGYDGPLILELAIEKGTPDSLSPVEAHSRARTFLKSFE